MRQVGHSCYKYRGTEQVARYLNDTERGNSKCMYSGAEKSLARPGRKQATATEDFDVHISYL